MRTLQFNVDGQILTPSPECDFKDLVPGTEGYLQAGFSFSSDWDGCAKVVGFWSMMGKEFEPQVLSDEDICIIPADVLKRKEFKMQVLGKREKYTITTNKLTVSQDGGAL